MKKTWLMGSAAAAALVAVSGAAQAADVMPIVVPVVTPAVVPPPGPVKVIQIDTSVSGYPLSGPYLYTLAAVDVRTASGWGFQLTAGNSLTLAPPPPLGGYLTVGGRVYRAFGDATVGVFADASMLYAFGVGSTFDGFTFGIDADYHTETVDVYYALGAAFDGGFQGIQSILVATIERGNFHIDAISAVGGPPFVALGGVKVGYEIGPITPYALVFGGLTPGPTLGGLVAVGVDVEKEIGERLTLTSNAQLAFNNLGGFLWSANAGFEYSLGAGDGPLSINGTIGTGSGGGIEWQIGIGLKFGDGRVSGFNGLLFEGLPTGFAL
ncbi:MAG: hypothetical protein IT534_01020 [Bauldia sp.]|nr:hypothetical protein [Bauldia sp.]